MTAAAYVRVRVSARSARLPFNGCEPGYIKNVCHAACCRSKSAPGGALVTVLPSEALRLIDRGAEIRDNVVVPAHGRCYFQGGDTGLCLLHDTGDKPFGCIASPFTLNANGTLIIRNRYKLLVCYNDGPRTPAYRAFAASLRLLFGDAEAGRLTRWLDAGRGDMDARMPAETYRMVRAVNDNLRRHTK